MGNLVHPQGMHRSLCCKAVVFSCAAQGNGRQRGYSLSEENTPFETPRERRGASPSTPDIVGFGLEGLHALRSVGAVYVAAPRAFCVSVHAATTPYSVGRE